MRKRNRVNGIALMLIATVLMLAAPRATSAATAEVGVLQTVYGFGTWTSVGFGLLGGVVCTLATAGVGAGICGAAATI